MAGFSGGDHVNDSWTQYLVQFVGELHDFWFAEFDSLLRLQGIDPANVYDLDAEHMKDIRADGSVLSARGTLDYGLESPFLRVWLPSDDVVNALCERAILVNAVYALWGEGETYAELKDAIRAAPRSKTDPYFAQGTDLPWCLHVAGYGRKYTSTMQEELRNSLRDCLPFQGPVRLKRGASARFFLIEEIGADPARQTQRAPPKRMYFGREICTGNRSLIDRFTLKKRKFLGPTSMSNMMSLIMANMGLARKGAYVIDPFVGTGSLLVPCTVFGAVCMGSDIDIRILRGKKGVNAFTNFKQYGLSCPDMVRLDISPRGRCIVELPDGRFDAIICDPPYGVRAGARQVGSRRAVVKPIPDHLRKDHIPMTKPYKVSDIMTDLVDTAARMLVKGGRFVYLLPVVIAEYDVSQVPQHPCLKIIANSEQRLSTKLARRLITMEKVADYDYAKADAYIAEVRKCFKASSDSCYDDITAKLKRMKK